MSNPRTDVPPRPLRLLLDTADVAAWKRWLPTGMIHGVTTNPVLLEKAGLPCTLEVLAGLAADAGNLAAGEIHLQTWGEDTATLVRRGAQLAGLATDDLRVLVKIPATEDGLKAAHQLQAEGCPVTLTAVFTLGQVMAAAALGVDYAAPYLGRMQDAGRDGMAEVRAMQAFLAATASPTRLLTASLRSASQVGELAAAGLDTFTAAPKILADLLTDDLTTRSVADFQRAATKK